MVVQGEDQQVRAEVEVMINVDVRRQTRFQRQITFQVAERGNAGCTLIGMHREYREN